MPKKTRRSRGVVVGEPRDERDQLDKWGVNIDDERGPTALEFRSHTPLNEPIPDDNTIPVLGVPTMMAPDFVMDPTGSGNRWYITEPNIKVGGLTCPHCQDAESKEGVLAEDVSVEPSKIYAVVQCGNCHGILFMEVVKK